MASVNKIPRIWSVGRRKQCGCSKYCNRGYCYCTTVPNSQPSPPIFQELCNNTESKEEASSSTSQDSLEEEDWECKECEKDDGNVGNYTGCNNCD